MEQDKLNLLFETLINEDSAQVDIFGSPIMVKVNEAFTKLSLSTTVYQAKNYIPKSVRNCLSNETPPVRSDIHTYVSLDEQKFQINLHYLGKLETLDKRKFLDLLEEFNWVAEEWRYVLDEHDRHDLIYIHAK